MTNFSELFSNGPSQSRGWYVLELAGHPQSRKTEATSKATENDLMLIFLTERNIFLYLYIAFNEA
jgi:hypothetical protein